MKICTYILIILQSFQLFAQDNYIVTAKNGLNIRSKGELSSHKIGKIPYGSIVTKLSETTNKSTIQDHGDKINGTWVKIQSHNSLYFVSKKETQHVLQGYVFDGYLSKIYTPDIITTEEITLADYNTFLQKAPKVVYKPKKIGDLDSIKHLLKDRVQWVTEFTDDVYKRDDAIKSIIIENGQQLMVDEFGISELYFEID